MFGDLTWLTCRKLECGRTVARRKIGEDPLDAEVTPEQVAETTEVPAGVPVKEPTPNGRNPWRRMSGCSEVRGMRVDERTHAPSPLPAPASDVATADDPRIAPHLYDDMS